MSRTVTLAGPLDEAAGKRVSAEIQRAAGHVIDLRIDSPGGCFLAAIMIALAVEEHDRAVVATVDGEACSGAAIVTLACDRRRMAPASSFMLHFPVHPRGWASEAHRRKSCAQILNLVSEYVPAPPAAIETWLASERFFSAREAKAEGLVDAIDGGPLPIFLKELAKRPPRPWLREYRELFEDLALREHVAPSAPRHFACDSAHG